MTISSTANRISYAGNASTTAFSFPYLFFADNDMVVTIKVDSTGVETVKTISTHYTVTGSGVAAGGTVTMGSAPASGETLILSRSEQLTQTLDLVENDPFPSSLVEQQFDTLTMITQQLQEEIDRTLRYPIGDTSGLGAELDSSVTRANKYLRFDATGAVALDTLVGNYKGSWGTSTAYVVNDVVSTGSPASSYICLVAHTSGTFSTDLAASKWQVLAAAGATGTTGNTGSAGAAATIAVGSVSTGGIGSSVTVANAGSTSEAVFNFSIPVGATGATGSTGSTGAQGDVAGPNSSTNNSLARFDGTDGAALKDGAVIGTDVAAYNADTLFADVADNLTKGFSTTVYDAGTKASGTFTPDQDNGNIQKAVNNGAHTLAPTTDDCAVIIQYTNAASAGTITTSGFTLVDGDDISTTNADDFFFYLTKANGFSLLTVKALQ